MKEISTTIYTFEEMITENLLYVDKTAFFHKLVKTTRGQFFLARPRRFGKSLALSTLEAIFKGKKELFRGLSIYDMSYDWQEYPVVHIDFARTVLTDMSTLTESLYTILNDCANNYSVDVQGSSPANLFDKLLRALNLKTGKSVVLLVDEYDKPLFDHMRTPEEAEEWRAFMDSFYQVIKGSESILRFVFITGVTKFAKVSIFSKLNNLHDITMDEAYGEMFGYTQKELEECFGEYIDEAVQNGVYDNYDNKLDREGLLSEMKHWYDGFRFTEFTESLYNPVSIGAFFIGHNHFKNYWFSTGTPSFLMKLLKRNRISVADLEGVVMPSTSFETFDVVDLAGENVPTEKLIQLLYQTGYLTIGKAISGMERSYALKFPNFEVSHSFKLFLANSYTGNDTYAFGFRLRSCAEEGDTEGMIELLKYYFASFPYDIQIKQEKYYQSMVRIVFEMSGMTFLTEERTNKGRIDSVLDVPGHLYIIEMKLNKTPEAAVEQIDDKKYSEKYILPAKEKNQKIHRVGINFCYGKDARNILEWREE